MDSKKLICTALFLIAATPSFGENNWNDPHQPFKIYGSTYYVGTAGLSSILITSDKGDVLIDGDTEQAPSQIAANIQKLGFKIQDVKLILNSHAHLDHAGGISQLQRLSGADVKASPSSAPVLKAGDVSRDDPQYGSLDGYPAVSRVSVIQDGETVNVGPIAMTAHFTPGHTSGGTTWTWDSCEGNHCLHMVYADSLSAVSSPGYKFGDHPEFLKYFEKSFAVLRALPCDIVLSPHPEVTDFWGRLAKRDSGQKDALINSTGCKNYAGNAERALQTRLATEKKN